VKLLSAAPLQVRYIIVGLWNTLVGFGLFTLFIYVLPVSRYLLALALATLFAGMNAYLTQRIYVWQSSATGKKEASKFFTVFIAQSVANIILLYLLVNYLNLNPLWTQYVIATVLIVLTYLSHKYWTFKVS
jgi:putative flippase GtrA